MLNHITYSICPYLRLINWSTWIIKLIHANGCIASNNYFAAYFGVLRSRAVEIITSLKNKGYIKTNEKKQGWKTVERTIWIIDENSKNSLLTNSKKTLPTDSKESPARLVRKSEFDSKDSPTHIINNITKDITKGDGSDFVSLWNSKERLPKIRQLTDKRRKALKVRMSEKQFAENWPLLIEKVACSDFLSGCNGHNWKADIDWLLPHKVAVTVFYTSKGDLNLSKNG